MVVITLVVLAPLEVVVTRAVQGRDGAVVLGALLAPLTDGLVLTWFRNSALVTVVTVVIAVGAAAPAGYVLARGRGRAVGAFALVVFGLQSLPTIMLLTPMFIVFVGLHLVDSLTGLVVVYVGLAVAVATWSTTAFFAAVPVELEEAAWLDGCGVVGAFRRVVLPAALPGLLSAAVSTFLIAWNDYWVAVVFIQSVDRQTLGLALAGQAPPAVALLGLLPPVLVFAVFHRSFRFGGVGSALAGR